MPAISLQPCRRPALRNWPCRMIAALAMALITALPFKDARAQANPAPHITAELVAEAPVAPGGTALLAIHMTPAPGWHGYWQNPGDAGYGMRVTWDLPKGAATQALQYPVPQTLLIAGLMNHVFTSDYAVLARLAVPTSAVAGSHLPIGARAEWLACSAQVCVPESAELHADLAITAAGRSPPRDPRFDAWQAQLPAPLGADAHFAADKDTIRLALPFPASTPLRHPHVFIAADGVIDYAAPQGFARDGDLLLVTLRRARLPAPGAINPSGVLRLDGGGSGILFSASPGPVPTGGTPIADESAGPPLASLPWLLLAALAGGLLLNVMPCVFPILSLKALSLARAGESEAEARAEGLAYSAGVVVACIALGAVLLALRAGGSEIGWAFQLQEPGVVAALLLLACAITANLLGLYEIGVPAFVQTGASGHRATIGGAFATGLLAAFVATPCTGPFMASAMGAALLLPAPAAIALFAALGVGIALPFLAIAFVPALRRRLPRPGAWMVWFRRAMALPMALTALALAWLASRLGGIGFAAGAGLAAALLLVMLALVGRAQRRGASAGRLVLAGVALSVMVALALVPWLARAPDPADTEASLLPALPFSATALAQARTSGHPVFAYFTADWCLTCKVNERLAIEQEDTRAAFARAGVIVLRGDWTRRDPAITRYLTGMGAAGVPLYAWYPPRAGSPRQLPQVLAPGSLAALASHPGS